MKKNKDFKVNSFFWPSLVMMIFILGAIWSNASFIKSSAPLKKVNNFINIPDNPVTLQQDIQAFPQTALVVQEGINQVIAMVRPSVVGVSRVIENQQLPINQSVNNGLSYLNPYQSQSGLKGSGIIVDSKGYVITSSQTVGNDKILRVTLFSGGKREFLADIIGIDPNTDLALLKIRSQGVFPTVIIGNSDVLKVGDIVFAIGSPFGFSRTVTMGIVSSHSRNLNIDGVRYPDMIQTDATVNQGNDGGPLVNIKGEIIGINMACFMPNNQFSGIGFAVPINNVVLFMDSMIQ
ncbi:MAG: trypsin-like peptidase domain-containing protein [Desulfobacterales bacterium]|nr:trypsin-like peptidase domain-containing protein [Desulfobacterales bacterium]